MTRPFSDKAIVWGLVAYHAWTHPPYALKAWGKRYGIWFGIGRQSERTKLVEKAWLRTVWPPYMVGRGVAFGIGHNSIRFGVYKVLGKLTEDEYDDDDVEEEFAILEQLGWRSGTEEGEVIGRWQPELQSAPEI